MTGGLILLLAAVVLSQGVWWVALRRTQGTAAAMARDLALTSSALTATAGELAQALRERDALRRAAAEQDAVATARAAQDAADLAQFESFVTETVWRVCRELGLNSETLTPQTDLDAAGKLAEVLWYTAAAHGDRMPLRTVADVVQLCVRGMG